MNAEAGEEVNTSALLYVYEWAILFVQAAQQCLSEQGISNNGGALFCIELINMLRANPYLGGVQPFDGAYQALIQLAGESNNSAEFNAEVEGNDGLKEQLKMACLRIFGSNRDFSFLARMAAQSQNASQSSLVFQPVATKFVDAVAGSGVSDALKTILMEETSPFLQAQMYAQLCRADAST